MRISFFSFDSHENPLLGGVARSAGVVRSLIQNPPQGLTALAPPERGIVRLFICRDMKHFHAPFCSIGAWMAPISKHDGVDVAQTSRISGRSAAFGSFRKEKPQTSNSTVCATGFSPAASLFDSFCRRRLSLVFQSRVQGMPGQRRTLHSHGKLLHAREND